MSIYTVPDHLAPILALYAWTEHQQRTGFNLMTNHLLAMRQGREATWLEWRLGEIG